MNPPPSPSATTHLEGVTDPALALRIMKNSLSIQSHFHLLLWMQGDFQEAIRHDALISFSGAIGGKTYHYDIVSMTPGIRTSKIPHRSISKLRKYAHLTWEREGGRVCRATFSQNGENFVNFSEMHEKLQNMRHAMFHAIPDTRFNADHLYLLLRERGPFSEQEALFYELLLPHVDAAVRKIDGLPILEPAQTASPPLLNSLIRAGLTTREIEILEWVRSGKTNIEIGMILDISSFTVKNHLQRIYRKINVSNRAQAVGKLEEIANGSIAYIGDQYGEQVVY